MQSLIFIVSLVFFIGCGGDTFSDEEPKIYSGSGKAVKGPLVNADVYVVFKDGTNYSVKTDSNGFYSYKDLKKEINHIEVRNGSFDGVDFGGVLRAPYGTQNITPITTLYSYDSNLKSKLADLFEIEIDYMDVDYSNISEFLTNTAKKNYLKVIKVSHIISSSFLDGNLSLSELATSILENNETNTTNEEIVKSLFSSFLDSDSETFNLSTDDIDEMFKDDLIVTTQDVEEAFNNLEGKYKQAVEAKKLPIMKLLKSDISVGANKIFVDLDSGLLAGNFSKLTVSGSIEDILNNISFELAIPKIGIDTKINIGVEIEDKATNDKVYLKIKDVVFKIVTAEGNSTITIEKDSSTYEVGGDILNKTIATDYNETLENSSVTNETPFNFRGALFLDSLRNYGAEYKQDLTSKAKNNSSYNVKIGISGHTSVFSIPYKTFYINNEKFHGIEGTINLN